ncbi:ABC transporter permease [Clostridium transplantifaecale]|uniref:fluoroquinolone export ABC transporter permease subunit n=1 Tax=Clostridium transplantifaecale TaxID=2479838 RepID=UPI000F639669|nr:ABC transporter permease [Clostridium transplantifaecale]
MKLGRLIRGDIHFQWKYGFYFIYFVLTVIYVCGITSLPENWKHNAVAIMVYSDPAAMGLFFMGAIVLLEKSQKVLNAIAISPTKVSEYILAKVFSLMFISCVVALILGITAGNGNISGIIAGTALTSSIFTMLGIMAATKIANLNQFLIVIMPIEILCFVPPILGLFTDLPEILRFFPLMACMNLITGYSQNLFLDLVLILATNFVLYLVAHKMVSKMWRSIGGVKI